MGNWGGGAKYFFSGPKFPLRKALGPGPSAPSCVAPTGSQSWGPDDAHKEP